jgi:hypothetical protein
MTTQLRVLASRERERAANRVTWQSQVRSVFDRIHLAVENVMRPLALPVAGGVFSAVTLFSVWVVPAYPALVHSGADVPTQLSTEARVKGFSLIGAPGQDVVMDVAIDGLGQVVDYKIIEAGSLPVDSRRKLENLLVFQTRFVPATSFGVPMPSRMRLWLSSSRIGINVKG